MNRDIYSLYALRLLLPSIFSHTWGLMVSAKVGSNTAHSVPALAELKMVEQEMPFDVYLPIIETYSRAATHFSTIAKRYAAPFYPCAGLSDDEITEKIQEFKPDVIVSIRFGRIFKAPMIKIPKHGILNLHSGILPHYRGVMATFWAMMNGETNIGTTLHRITDSTIDTGPVLCTTRVTLDPALSYMENVKTLYPEGIALMGRAIESLSKKKPLITLPPTEDSGMYYGFPKQVDVERFLERGHRLYTTEAYETFMRHLVETAV